MNEKSHSDRDALSGPVKGAVESIRAKSAPTSAVHRSKKKAKEIGKMKPFQPTHSRVALITSALAAAGLLMLILVPEGREAKRIAHAKEKEPNLEMTDVGLDPNLELAWDIKRIADQSVPGPVDPADPVGIGAHPIAPPISIPPPPGTPPPPSEEPPGTDRDAQKDVLRGGNSSRSPFRRLGGDQGEGRNGRGIKGTPDTLKKTISDAASQQKQAEATLAEAERRYKSIQKARKLTASSYSAEEERGALEQLRLYRARLKVTQLDSRIAQIQQEIQKRETSARTIDVEKNLKNLTSALEAVQSEKETLQQTVAEKRASLALKRYLGIKKARRVASGAYSEQQEQRALEAYEVAQDQLAALRLDKQINELKQLIRKQERIRSELIRNKEKTTSTILSGLNAQLKELETKKKKLKLPKIWKRNNRRPTFARVYVGDGNSLELVSLRVTVTIDGPRARTLVDHVFRNPHNRQLEGTFEYPLPTGAAPSYFGMFLGHTRNDIPPMFSRRGNVPPLPQEKLAGMTPQQVVKAIDTEDWGRLQEARIVGKQKALQTYEQIVRGKIDPALLEYAGGNTFKGRVFPIPAKGYNRVLIAYEELLPWAEDKNLYRYPLPDCKLTSLEFTCQVNNADGTDFTFLPEGAAKSASRYLTTFNKSWKDQGPGGDVVLSYKPRHPEMQVISGRQGENGNEFVYARIRPKFKSQTNKSNASQAVFLLDASMSESPDRFGVSMKLMQRILQSDESIKQFNVMTFNVGTSWLSQQWLDNTKQGRESVLNQLDGIVLEGATDWSAVLRRLEEGIPGLKRDAPVNVFVLSDGNATWGNRDINPMIARFESRCSYRPLFHCYRVGLGAENLELYQALTRRAGGIFNCYTEAELKSAAFAHRKQCWQIDKVSFVGGPRSSDVLLSGRQVAVYPGGELIVTGRLAKTGRTTILVEGTYLGKKKAQEYTIEAKGGSELAARAWGEVAVASLLAMNEPRFDELVTAYCQQFNIASKVASFLVLENNADFKRLNLEKERGKTVSGDLGEFLAKLWKEMGKPLSAREALDQFLSRVNPQIRLFNGKHGDHVKNLLAMLDDKALSLPETRLKHVLLSSKDVTNDYREALKNAEQSIHAIIDEAKRRLRHKDVDGAVQALSSIIEKYPSRSDALRLVGYRLMALKQASHASRLFEQVQRQRPFEPHSYRDLARSLEQCGRFELAALQYEIVLAGTWHNRFGHDLKPVVREEYARMMRQAIGSQRVQGKVANHFGERLEKLSSTDLQSDLRVTITWNTDATDVDLWVIEPDGTKCFYEKKSTKNGGRLSQDLTNGYGPERYQIKTAKRGAYKVVVHYYRSNGNLIGGESHVDVVVTRHAGTKNEKIERHNVILKKSNEAVEVTTVQVK